MMDYADKQTGLLKTELVLPLKKENEKINIVTDRLRDKKIFDSEDIEEIKSIEVFEKVV